MSYKIASWNVNGLRACVKKGFHEWVKQEDLDIICLQETKAWPEQLEENLTNPEDYFAYYACAKKKGYSGVALLSKKALGKPIVKIGLDVAEYDDEGRSIIAEYDDFIIFNCYFPNGQRDHGRVPYKLAFSTFVADHALKLENEKSKPVIITGDYNTSHTEIDLKNAKANQKSTGFLPIEREWMDNFIAKGFTDIFRSLNPGKEGQYTWWTYRSNCREKNVGWRLDYFFTTKGLIKKIKDCYHQPEVMGSDHCPVILKIK